MTSHPKGYDHRRHYIFQTEVRHPETFRRLYGISGLCFNKFASEWPFLTSAKAARKWLNEQYSKQVGEG